jgi:hypothetical protein
VENTVEKRDVAAVLEPEFAISGLFPGGEASGRADFRALARDAIVISPQYRRIGEAKVGFFRVLRLFDGFRGFRSYRNGRQQHLGTNPHQD